MKKILLALMSIALMAGSAFAQQKLQEVVYLKNGSIVRGVITEQVPEKSLKIQTADGSVFSYTMSEVEKITKEPVANVIKRIDGIAKNYEKSYQRIQVGYGRIGIEVEDMMNGPSLIWTKGISLHHKTPVYLQFGANVFYGSGTGNYADTKFISVNIPVAVAYQFTKTFSLYGGLNTRGNILGKKGTYDGWGDKNDSDDWFSGEDAAKRFNFGYILGVNFTHNRFTWGLEYVRDFTEFMARHRLSYIGISAGIKF